MARHLQKTLIDYLVIAISPALIMALVGSLVFFLIEVFYQGSFHGRLQYVFALFVVGVVLIGRISIEDGREYAALFAVPLGIVTLLAINKFVAFQGGPLTSFSFVINCGLIGLVWWSADRLTWDCTLIDDQEEDSGEGLLEAVGLDRPDRAAMQTEIEPTPTEPEATTSRDERPQSWWEQFVERRRRPHAPGVWVIYFSLAALPLFGVGQLIIPAGNPSSRQYAFQLLFVYTASGLGLLLTTSFLGLRRYLRQRRQEMPLAMVSLWLGIGAVLIVGVMATAMLLPRPNAEYAVSELPFRIGSPDQKSSRRSMGREGVKEDKPGARHEPSVKKPSDYAPASQSGKTPSQDQQKSAKDDKSAEKQNAGRNADKSADSQKGAEGKPRAASEGQPVRDKPKDADTAQPDQNANKNATGGGDTDKKKSPESSQAESQAENQGATDGQSTKAFPLPDLPTHAAQLTMSLLNFLKLFLYGGLALLALYAIWTNREAISAALGNLSHWLADFWHNLFGGTSRRSDEAVEEALAKPMPQRRFVDFTDPFATGTFGRYPPRELVRYTFEALEAWARDHDCPREPEQTPHEFTRHLASNVASLADDAARLADLYCQAAYAPDTLSPSGVTCLSRLWQQMAQAS